MKENIWRKGPELLPMVYTMHAEMRSLPWLIGFDPQIISSGLPFPPTPKSDVTVQTTPYLMVETSDVLPAAQKAEFYDGSAGFSLQALHSIDPILLVSLQKT